MGNHDRWDPPGHAGFSTEASRAISWTREQLEGPQTGPPQAAGGFARVCPTPIRIGRDLFVHGLPRKPLSEYIFPEDEYNSLKINQLFVLVDRYGFHGHTHVPGIIAEDFRFFSPNEIDSEYNLGETKLMINVGSVGQPRAGDNRASYVILDYGIERVPRLRPGTGR